jgi:S1-C subfamily serine protease
VASAVLLLLIVLVGSVAIYYNTALTVAQSRLAELQQVASNLQVRNGQLEQQLSTLNQSSRNVSVLGFNPTGIYKSANQSVVTIQGSKVVTVLTIFGPRQSIETILGSGFVIEYTNSYYLLTNFHVVDGVINVTVTFWNGDSYPAKVVGADSLSDIAVVSTSAPMSDLYPLSFSSSSTLEVGIPVVAIGNPFGLSGSITFGIVSQLGRTIQYQSTSGTFAIADIIQFSAPINPGNSGGPLLDANGFVVGITTAAVSGSQGLGFAIPSDTILRELPYLISTGKYDRHPYLGIQAVDMNYQLSQIAGTNVTYGILIEKTSSGSPAERAGLRGGSQIVEIGGQQYAVGGDIIVSISGVRIVNYDAYATYMERCAAPGQVIQVTIIRSGAYQVVSVVVGALSSQ